VRNSSIDFQKRMLSEFAPGYREARERRINRKVEREYRAYLNSLAKQELRVQHRADRFDRRSHADYEKAMHRVWAADRRLMDEEELRMSQARWTAYCENLSDKLHEYSQRHQDGRSAMRPLTVNRMGFYHCGRMFDLRNAQEVQPRFVLSDGKAIEWKTAYLFDRKHNAVIPFDRSDGTLQLDPASVRMVFVLDRQGNLYRLNESEVIAMNRGKATQRIMHLTVLDRSTGSLGQVQEMLGPDGESDRFISSFFRE